MFKEGEKIICVRESVYSLVILKTVVKVLFCGEKEKEGILNTLVEVPGFLGKQWVDSDNFEKYEK